MSTCSYRTVNTPANNNVNQKALTKMQKKKIFSLILTHTKFHIYDF